MVCNVNKLNKIATYHRTCTIKVYAVKWSNPLTLCNEGYLNNKIWTAGTAGVQS
jgi:hypothetical protein